MSEIGVKAVKKVPDKKDTFYSGGIGGSKYYEFQVGQTYEITNPPVLCKSGFHYFRKEDLCFGIDFYEDNKQDTVFIEVEALGEIVSDTYKRATNKIKILRYIPKKEWQKTIDKRNNTGDQNSGSWNSGNRNSGSSNSGDNNSGHLNTGNQNSGSWNSGNWNLGHRNSGDRNLGDKNSGDWNLGDQNPGCFNPDTPKTIRVFGKSCDREVWEAATKPSFLYFDIKPGETYKEAFRRSWEATPEADRQLLERLPNFDWAIFTEISGIEKPKERNKMSDLVQGSHMYRLILQIPTCHSVYPTEAEVIVTDNNKIDLNIRGPIFLTLREKTKEIKNVADQFFILSKELDKIAYPDGRK